MNDDESWRWDVVGHFTNSQRSSLNQILSQDTLSPLDFDQEGIIDAVTPALAAELTPKLSIGAAVNFYQDSPLPDRRISSRIVAKYSGRSGSRASITDQLTTSGTYDYEGVAHLPPSGSISDSDRCCLSRGVERSSRFPKQTSRLEPINTPSTASTRKSTDSRTCSA